MEKYYCATCGYKINSLYDQKTHGYLICPVCKSRMVSEEEIKEREEISKVLENETQDETKSPIQDAIEAVLDTKENIVSVLKYSLQIYGNDITWYNIEGTVNFIERFLYRQWFFELGGIAPKGKSILIKEKKQ